MKNKFSRLKATTSKFKKSNLVYSIPCEDCNKQYIGQTSQRLHDGLNDYKCTKNAARDLNNHKKTKNYEFDHKDTKILTTEPKRE